MAVRQNRVPLVNIKIAGKWMFIPLKMVLYNRYWSIPIYISIYIHSFRFLNDVYIITVKSPWLVSSCVHQAADHRRKVGEKLLQDHVDLWRLSARHAFGRNELRLSWREQRRQFPVPSEPTREQWEARIQDILVPRCFKDMARQCSKYFKMLKRYRFNMQNVLQRSQLVGNRILQHSDILRYIKPVSKQGPEMPKCHHLALAFRLLSRCCWISASPAFLWNQLFPRINTSLYSS